MKRIELEYSIALLQCVVSIVVLGTGIALLNASITNINTYNMEIFVFYSFFGGVFLITCGLFCLFGSKFYAFIDDELKEASKDTDRESNFL